MDFGALIGGQVVERIADLDSTKLAFSSMTRIARLPRANARRPSVSSRQVIATL